MVLRDVNFKETVFEKLWKDRLSPLPGNHETSDFSFERSTTELLETSGSKAATSNQLFQVPCLALSSTRALQFFDLDVLMSHLVRINSHSVAPSQDKQISAMPFSTAPSAS